MEGRLLRVLCASAVRSRSESLCCGQRVYQKDAAGNYHTYSFGLQDSSTGTQYTPGLGQTTGGATYFHHQDWLGSTRYLSDGNGVFSSKPSAYDAFGQTQVSGDAQKLTDYQFAGGVGYEHEADGAAGVGLFYLSQRYYDPMAGRFISRDPISFAGGLNLYGYCGNDATDAVDPSGEDYEEAYHALVKYRQNIISVAHSYGIQPELLGGAVWMEWYAGGAPLWHQIKQTLGSWPKFLLLGGNASLGIANTKILRYWKYDPCSGMGDRWRLFQQFNSDPNNSLKVAAQLLVFLGSRSNRYPGRLNKLTPFEMSILLTEYNGGTGHNSPAATAQPSPKYGRRFLKFYGDIQFSLGTNRGNDGD